jgi:hypothetical protein
VDLRDWVSQQLAKGYTKEQLEQYLQKQGYDQAAIRTALGFNEPIHHSMLPKVMFFGFILVLISVGGLFIFLQGNDPEPPTPEPIIPTEPAVEQPSDLRCKDVFCFKDRFRDCEPALFAAGVSDTLTFVYEVVKKNGELCDVKITYFKNPDPGLQGKNMVCAYDNSLDFEIVSQSLDPCEGELADRLRKDLASVG